MSKTLTHNSRFEFRNYFPLPLLLVFAFNFAYTQNAIVTENLNAGVPASQWDIPKNSNGTFGDKTIQGFGTDISVNVGGTINFKITITSGTDKTFGIKIYRIGYYQGNGARLIADLGTSFTGITQNACSFDNTTGLTDCGNWTTSASWAVPSTAVSGLYVAKLTRSAAGGGGSSHIAFIVRNDASTSQLLFKTSDATWQAYNPYGGYSLYVGAGMPFNHGDKVSYNRPFLTRDGGGGGGASEDFFMNAEYPMIRFLESNGFDISYTTDMDMARSTTNPVTNHKVFLSVGHDEYWSKEERNTVEAARAAGKNLAFFSGNEVYWKTRWENSVDGTSTPFRTMVCYKEGTLPTPGENACGGKCDPSTEWTGLWRDGCSFPNDNACKPENALSGEISWDGTTSAIMVPDTYKNLRFWRNTSVATLGAGQTATMTPGTLGYEWDWEQYQSSYPPGRITMSNTSFDGHVHKLSFYKSTAGGFVFGAGSVQWSWGLDANHDSNEQGGGGAATVAMQQATINLFADMGVQPASIQTGLTAATATTDVTPPVTKFTSPATGSTFTSLSPISFSGTATDVGGVVAGVEISFDGGATWAAATGTTSWTYSWTPIGNGTFTVIVRGIDDSGNYTATASSPSITITVNATAQNCPCTIFGTAVPSVTVGNDNAGGIVVGTKFRSALSGTVTGIRFFKASGNSGTHQGLLYSGTGTLLAQATFTGETATGWQQVSFSSPVTISAGTTYIAAYFSSSGNYSSTNNYFSQAIVNSPLTGLADGTDGTNGVYIYASAPAFPINSYQKGNYWVDAVFTNTTTITANAGPNQTITLPTSTVTLNGSGSTGTISSYSWTLVSGPNTPVITTPTTVTTTVTGLVQGTYVFQLSVNAGVSTAQVTVTVNPIPPPVANAGPKQTITLPTSTVTLNGSASTGNITSYSWTLVSGPNAPTITTPSTVTTTVTGLIQGTYIFQLALNGTASIAKDTVIVNPAAPPVANAGSNQTITLPVSSVTLNGNGSTGTITSYAWTNISGPNTPVITTPANVSTTVTGLIQGSYVFQLSLNAGASVSQVTVTVNAASTSTTIFTTQTPAGPTENDALALELGVKFRTNTAGSITGIRFYKTTGNSGTHTGELYSSTGTRLAQATFTGETATGWQQVLFSSPVAITAGTTYVAAYFSSSGNYTSTTNYFTTAVVNGPITALADGTDGSNGVYRYSTTAVFPSSTYQKSNYWVDAIFSSGAVAPIANAGPNQTITLPTSTVTLNGSGSTGTISSYAWTLVSGPNVPVITTPTAVSTTVTGLIQGTYVFKLSLNGTASTAQVTIQVNPAPPPVANAGPNQTITLPTSTVTLNGSGSTGTISSYSWTLVSGPNTPVITTPTTVTTTVTGLVQGTYVFQLSVNAGVSTAQVTVTVNPIPPPVANAGPKQTITLPTSTVTLNGSASTGNITSYSWTLVSGPNAPTITTPSTVTTTVTGLIQGTYIFQLALNGTASIAKDTVIVNPAAPPVANAGSNQTITLPVSSVTLNGNGSTGTITSYAWTNISGPNTPVITTPANVSTTVTGLIQGSYVFQLSLNAGASVSQVTVTVNAASTSTTIFTTQTPAGPTENDALALELGVKFRTNTAGSITGIRFYKTTGNSGTHTGELYSSTGTRLAQATFTGETATGWQQVLFSSPVAITAGTTYVAAYFSSSGNYTSTTNYFTTAVVNGPITALADGTDGSNGVYRYSTTAVFPSSTYQKSNYWVDAIFSTGAVAPVANAGPNQTITLPTSTVTLNGSGSTGTISSYAWTLVSGPNVPVITTPTAVSTTVTGLIQGTYVFKLSLNGAVSTSQVTITVNAAQTVVANAGANQTIVLPASSVTLNGSGSTGTISSYAWTKISGPGTPIIATPSGVTTLVTGLVQGTYVFQLSLNSGASVSQVTVNVIPASTPITIFTTQTPTVTTSNAGIGIETGVKFRSSVGGTITGVRFYKTSGNTGTHTGELYSSIGTRLAQAVFTNETATGWQTVIFSSAVPITAGVTYIAAYYSSSGNYISTDNYFSTAVINAPLTALADGTDGPNGVFVYGNAAAFPANSSSKTNYWVDAIFNGSVNTVDVTPPGIIVTSPAAAATNVSANSAVNVFFNEQLNPSTVSGNTVFLQNGTTNIASSVINNTEGGVTLTPSAPLNPNTVYTVTVKGGTGTNKITDVAGNALAKDTVWSFTTAPKPTIAIPANGPGGPILLISSASNAFSRYPVEILRAEGWNAFNALDISAVTTTEINKYDVVVVGDITLTAAQVTMLTNWVNAGGTLIAFHPDPQLAALLGISSAGGTMSDKYLLVNTASAPGFGIVNQTIQYHGVANLYNVNAGTNIVATLYSDATTATIYPAVTSRNVGTLGGQAIAFAYDLAKSVVYTRQGNPAWAGQNRDGQDAVIRADNLFFGNASFDPQPDWVNLNKVAIPQADEQQRLFTNIIMAGSFDRKPLPRFWFLPKGKKAAVVMTGDDHANGGTMGRFNRYLSLSSSNTPSDVANWNAIRSTSYMYPFSPITNAQIAIYQNQGFELAFHLNPNCSVWTPSQLQNYFSSQMSDFTDEYYVANPLMTHRIHCLSWSDWATLPKTEVQLGIRLNVSYYYWPPSWINDRPGMFTGSGMPMRFADTDGSLIDSYQVPTQMTDESGQTYPKNIDSLLNRATGAQGYYGVFCANMHTDDSVSAGSDAIIASALAKQIPVVSSKQMLDWLDARNNSTFSNYTWSNGTLGFTVTQDPKALNLKGMLPQTISAGSFISLTQNGLAVNTTIETIKGISYIFFDASNGNYVATYAVTAPGAGSNPALAQITPAAENDSTNFTNYLGQNYPNPFSLNTRINYSIAASNVVELILYDMQGRPVKVLVNEVKKAGNYIYDLNTGNLAKGIYFYRIRSGSFIGVKKLIIE